MARVRNAFKIRAADAPIMETAQFLQLYCPLLLGQLERDDLFVPKLIVVRGSPGSGKSSLLRLFETETLMAIHGRRASQPGDTDLLQRLTELGVLHESGPRVVGVYIHCDSGLRDIGNLTEDQAPLGLLNTLLDVRIALAFIRGLRRLSDCGYLGISDDHALKALPAEEAPPPLFAEPRTIAEMEQLCAEAERSFGDLLNSFPGDPLPETIQPHARVYALRYLAVQICTTAQLREITPIVMLDDLQDLAPEQRTHVKAEFVRRAAVPRWIAVRTHVLGLEDLVSMEGADEGREYREIAVDEIFREKPNEFIRFSGNVIQRRLQATEAIQQYGTNDLRQLLRGPEEIIPGPSALRGIGTLLKRARELRAGRDFVEALEGATSSQGEGLRVDDAIALERSMILLERLSNRGKLLFPGMETPETADSKTMEAAKLFMSRRFRVPYYFGLDAIIGAASGNVEQLLSIMAKFVDRMVHRADLDRDVDLSAKDQQKMLRAAADDYYGLLEAKHRRGAAIRQLVDNLGLYFEAVTTRGNAPIAPGVNGFGLTRPEIAKAVEGEGGDAQVFREVITNAVAGNVLAAKVTKQGQAGSEKVVFYMNRLLCVRHRLPFHYGGWQHLPTRTLTRMMLEPVPIRDLLRKGAPSAALLWADEG